MLLLPLLLMSLSIAYAKPVELNVQQTTLYVNNKPLKVYVILQNDGTEGYIGVNGTPFDVIINNKTQLPITLHWHGLIDKYADDGVPFVTQLPLAPGKSQHIKYPLVQAGTFWMHSHKGLQEAELMAAPLIIKPAKQADNNIKDVTVMLEDITYESPTTVLYKLQHPDLKKMKMSMDMDMEKSNKPDLYDVKSDALLANRKTLINPEIINVTPGEKIHLRLINGDAANNLYVHLPKNMVGTVTAIDGENTKPYFTTDFQLGMANTLDMLLTIPEKKSGVYPVFFQAEGRKLRTGIILRSGKAGVPKYSSSASTAEAGFTYDQYYNLHPVTPLQAKKVNRTLTYDLTGDMAKYKWAINGQYWPKVTPEFIKEGERVKIVIHNSTGMAHPMHFHGHIFQLVSINGNQVNAFKGSTVMVLPNSTVTLVFDADNPGLWAFHCHLLYHLAAGMMTTINYVSTTPPPFYLKKIGMTLEQYDKLRKNKSKK